MNKILFLLLFTPCYFFGQNKGVIFGVVKQGEIASRVSFCSVIIKEVNKVYYTNEQGFFKTEKLPYGEYTVIFQQVGYKTGLSKMSLDKPEVKLNYKFNDSQYILDEVVIKDKHDSIDFSRRMRAIEGVMINQGKKNEVIVMEGVNANKATNSGRQIYSKVPGLNIWESDGAGIQLGIGGRGLNPSRTSNFNTRQNGYDISADALGYPESYYTPPTEAIKEIQLIRGAASLQFGTQFGGLLNFVLNTGPKHKKLQLTARQSIGSYNIKNTFVSLGGDNKRLNYYAYYQNKSGDDWRPNSGFNVQTAGINVRRYLNDANSIRLELTKMSYTTQQPGGLTDLQFEQEPSVSIRDRNWFEVDWNLAAFHFDHEFNSSTKLNSRFFGLHASRKALGFLGQINRIDPLEERDLIWGEFRNFGNETRFLNIYSVNDMPWALLVGARYYQGYNLSKQGLSTNGFGPDFYYLNPTNMEGSSYEFPSKNISLFTENIFNINEKLSITPGVRFEYINTKADGTFREMIFNLAGDVVFDTNYTDLKENKRSFLIGGIGINYKFNDTVEFYANFSQNYRSINFTDMQIQNANFKINPDLQDEKGFNVDLGIRGQIINKLNYDVSVFMLSYANRIGTTIQVDPIWYTTYQYRTNISSSITKGVEAMVEADLWKFVFSDTSNFSLRPFINASVIDARYIDSEEPAFNNKKVELVPPFNFKTGLTIAYKSFSLSYQYSFTQSHFSDATNSQQQANAVNGIIPDYSIMDLSLKWSYKLFQLETGLNNLTNDMYFTRRATGYPGPGIIPSAPRNYYVAIQIKI
jgi:Fe(3+) dicitrate transport protein